jgi:hypothetical protein
MAHQRESGHDCDHKTRFGRAALGKSSVVLWLPGRSGVGFDAFVMTITSCQPFCDGRHILRIALMLFFFQSCRSGGSAIAFSALAGNPPARNNEGEGL